MFEFRGISPVSYSVPSWLERQGIYCLRAEGEVIYVGQSKDVLHRVGSHSHKNEFVFDTYDFIPVPDADELSEAEAYYIYKFNPLYNTNFPNSQIYLTSDEIREKYCGDYKTQFKISSLKWSKKLPNKFVCNKTRFDLSNLENLMAE